MQTNKVRPEPKIPDHEVLRKIGGGAYGEVWLAQGVTGALRAVKTVWHNDFEDERGFEREFEGILKYEPISRDHPGLVHILHVGRGETDGEPFYYYVMELGDDLATGSEINPVEYEARTLRSDMKAAEGRALDVEECISAGRLLADGLEHLHQNGLAHRDVKPSNVIFVDGKAKLADIGLVALRGQQTFVGTEGFVPPEGPGSAQADVYSLGKVLYEMATGKDRLDFPELPDELPEGAKLKRWRLLNSVICDVCEPKISRRKIKAAGELAAELGRLESGRRRPIRVRPGLVAALLATAVGAGGATQFMNWRPLEVPSELGPAKPVEMARVSISSLPHEATVISEEGEELGETPLEPLEFPVGSLVSFTLRMDGFRDEVIGGEVTRNGLVLIPELTKYKPPVPQDFWGDVFDVKYRPVDDHHESQYYVSATSWNNYLAKSGENGGKIVTLSENGMNNEVVLATPAEAKAYTKWLGTQCRETHLDEVHWIEPRFEVGRADLDAEWVRRKMRPFYCVVRKENKATIWIASDPPGADVYIQGERYFTAEHIGKTPPLPPPPAEGEEPWQPLALSGEEGEEPPEPDGLRLEVKLGPKGGNVTVIVELAKFKRAEESFTLRPDDMWKDAMIVKLERENIFDFDRNALENSFGMKFVPVRKDLELLVGVWETRVQDYEKYVDALKTKIRDPGGKKTMELEYAKFVNEHAGTVSMPPPPLFEQAQDHPVVNVTREDAEQFCRWLTLKERKSKDIGADHEYRLPTDSEWSLLLGLNAEFGIWPIEKHGRVDGFLWGDIVMPPPPGAGNFADQSAVDAEVVLPEDAIRGYQDGYAYTAPVGRFSGRVVGRLEIFDLEGNVLEWVSNDYSALGQYNVARGASWKSHRPKSLKTSARTPLQKQKIDDSGIYGFRVVLAKVPVIPEKEVEKAPEKGSEKATGKAPEKGPERAAEK